MIFSSACYGPPTRALAILTPGAILLGMTRNFKQSVIATTPEVDQASLDVLAAAEKQYRGQVPDDVSAHAEKTQAWLDNKPVERGGPAGLEPTRFGDWERNGRCFDF